MLPLKRGFTIYQSPECPYCRESVSILNKLRETKGIPCKIIDFKEINGGKDTVLQYFNQHSQQYNFNINHRTKPIIFFNTKFIGGNSELKQLLDGV